MHGHGYFYPNKACWWEGAKRNAHMLPDRIELPALRWLVVWFDYETYALPTELQELERMLNG
jgi:hypothetical protein